jgi:hypothetical protein
VSRVEDSGDDRSFEAPPYLGAVPTWVVKRGGNWQLDNGYCRGARVLVYFSGKGPEKTADCKPNEVQVPLVVGMSAQTAIARLADQPLGAELVYKPAKAGRVPGIVVDQIPRGGGLSANDDVTLVVSKARFGLLPNLVGSSVVDVTGELKRLRLRYRIVTKPGPNGTVLQQEPAAGVAISPGVTIELVVGDD